MVVGDCGLKEGKLEIKWRAAEKPVMIAVDGAASEIARLVQHALQSVLQGLVGVAAAPSRTMVICLDGSEATNP